jgi:hypothetical protein
MSEATAIQCEQEAARLEAAREESFERCDTDGFVSQWADGILASKMRLQAEIERNNGMSEFPALFDLEGNRLPAKLITVPDRFKGYGTRTCWALCDPATGRFTGVFVTPATIGSKRSENCLARKGYRQGTEMAPAKADIVGYGRGLSGNAWAAIVRTDGGYPGARNNSRPA